MKNRGLGLTTLLLALLSSCIAAGSGEPHGGDWKPEYVLIATAENITVNCESRYSVVLNGTSPAPTLHLQEGKTTWVRVHNRMVDQNTTVHWHGLSLRTAPFSDGTPLVSQWPIAPGEFFDYEIHPEVGDAGTYFYHSHVGLQAGTAHGLLLVDQAEDAAPPYEYDEEVPILFGDYYRKLDDEMEAGLVANPFVWSGEPDAIKFNDRTGNASFSNATDDSCKPYVISVKPGKTYRLQVVGVTSLSFVMMAIEGHGHLTIIEADGQYTKPAETDHIQVAPGQRFSALLTTKSQQELDADGKSSYWIRYESRDRPTRVTGYAMLQYESESGGDVLPSDLPDSSPVALPEDLAVYTRWLEYTLESLHTGDPFPTLSDVTRTVYITVEQHVVDGFYNGSVNGMLQWDQNNLTWAEAYIAAQRYEPYLVTAYTTQETPDYEAAMRTGGWDPSTRAWPAKVGEVLDIVWLSNSGPTGGFDFHPMHAHGAHYWDIGSGNGTYDAEENEKNFANHTPAKRDTTQLYRYQATGAAHTTSGWRAWRLKVTEDNVGAWMMHCHILAHAVMGMQTVWVFGNATDILQEIPEPYLNGYLEYGGSAYGNESYDPLTVSFFDE
ncbi:Cupredoxin [Xylariaceae sp. FL0804]|nr:Cupredoxin [Xylariaceae sp. FL0804]